MIAETETALLAHIHAVLGDSCNFVEPHPGNWSDDTVNEIILSGPSVYVAWLGAKPTSQSYVINNEWAVFIVANVLNGTREDPLGAYQMAEKIMAMFAGRQLAGVGTMKFDRAKNLWSDIRAGAGNAVYALYFMNPAIVEPVVPVGELDDFLRHYQEFKQRDGAPVLKALVNLPGPGENHEES
jgi:phage gp37-like protein